MMMRRRRRRRSTLLKCIVTYCNHRIWQRLSFDLSRFNLCVDLQSLVDGAFGQEVKSVDGIVIHPECRCTGRGNWGGASPKYAKKIQTFEEYLISTN